MKDSKIKNFFSTIWKWVLKPIFWIGGIVGLIFVGKKLYVIIGNIFPGEETHFHKIDETTISVYDKKNNSYKRIELPIDRRTGKRVKADDVQAIGLSEKKVIVNVKSTHAHSTDVFLGNQ